MFNFTLLSTRFTTRQKVKKIEDANYGCKDEGNDDEDGKLKITITMYNVGNLKSLFSENLK